MRLWISDQPDVLDGAACGELGPEFLLADNEGQISNEDGASEVFPGIHARVSTTSRDFLMLAFLLFESLTKCVDSQMFLHEKHLVELDLSLSSARSLAVENVGILAVLKVAEVFLDYFGALRLFWFLSDADGPEPDFFDFSTTSELLL